MICERCTGRGLLDPNTLCLDCAGSGIVGTVVIVKTPKTTKVTSKNKSIVSRILNKTKKKK